MITSLEKRKTKEHEILTEQSVDAQKVSDTDLFRKLGNKIKRMTKK